MPAGASSEPVRPCGPIGPGLVALVVGPSGAGKDAILCRMRDRLAGNARFFFPQRAVTRAANAAEDHLSLTQVEFEAWLQRGAFALHWEAHGLSYGIPAEIDAAVRSGTTVVFNASRHIVPTARARYTTMAIVLIDAPLAVRAQRLAARDRERAEEISARVERQVAGFSAADAACIIDNSGTVEAATDQLVAWLQTHHWAPADGAEQ